MWIFPDLLVNYEEQKFMVDLFTNSVTNITEAKEKTVFEVALSINGRYVVIEICFRDNFLKGLYQVGIYAHDSEVYFT